MSILSVTISDKYISNFIREEEFKSIQSQVSIAHEQLHSATGLGSDFTGWLDLPLTYDKKELQKIKNASQKIISDSDILIVIGIGGSYLGARAAIEFLKSPNYKLLTTKTPKIYFAGNSLSPSSLNEIIELCSDKDVSLNVISKSGTTTEPAIAFRVLKKFLEKKYGHEGAKERIYCTTDKQNGALKKLADREGYETFVIPDNIGGRFSVLTAVGLLPIAVCGADIDALMSGAEKAYSELQDTDLEKNPCYKYAAMRNLLYRKGKKIEILASYEPRFAMLNEWYKQLFGESEGKDQKGLFPASAIFSTDLHSMGQFIQDGSRVLFETVLMVDKYENNIIIENDPENIDGLNYLEGMTMSYINEKAFEGTILAHTSGNVPNIVLRIEKIDEYNLGYLIYFFEKACAISGYILGVNPFDQPGVESYKKNMFSLLGKPGYEKTV